MSQMTRGFPQPALALHPSWGEALLWEGDTSVWSGFVARSHCPNLDGFIVQESWLQHLALRKKKKRGYLDLLLFLWPEVGRGGCGVPNPRRESPSPAPSWQPERTWRASPMRAGGRDAQGEHQAANPLYFLPQSPAVALPSAPRHQGKARRWEIRPPPGGAVRAGSIYVNGAWKRRCCPRPLIHSSPPVLSPRSAHGEGE